ncbi:hypothetical protein F2P81_025104 [Scophthalmus maximus]|uniref:Uncharacterized protein n=1 Tax=Scophthalmus maximus TaxID=52904 RepID=A0A6A4RUJ7_SCOMX|nr:hypothetical protein F2P81_025104 [Scophthalmus maximus]
MSILSDLKKGLRITMRKSTGLVFNIRRILPIRATCGKRFESQLQCELNYVGSPLCCRGFDCGALITLHQKREYCFSLFWTINIYNR